VFLQGGGEKETVSARTGNGRRGMAVVERLGGCCHGCRNGTGGSDPMKWNVVMIRVSKFGGPRGKG